MVLGLCAAAAAGLAQPASAQMGGMGFGEVMQPDFNRRDIVLIVDGLNLDETQKLILETLYDSYEQDFRAKGDEFRDRMNALREEAMPSEEREAMFRETREKFETAREGIRAKYEELQAQYENGEIPEEVEEKFREEVRQHMNSMREEMREQGRSFFQDSTAQDMFGKLAPLSEEWLRAKNQLRDQFIADLNMQLTEDQVPNWPGVERMIRRTKSLQRGRISGESADLFQIVRSLNLEAEQTSTIQPILDQYEIDLDAKLKQRDEYLASSGADLLRAMQTSDAEDGIAVMEKQTKLRTQVRDVNDRYAMSIQEALESPLAEKFRDEFHVRAYPRVYEPTRMERVLTAAEGLEGLEPSIAEAVTEMKASYLAEVNAKNESLLTAVRKYEPEDAVRMARRMAARFTGQQYEEGEDMLRQAMDERSEIGERYRDQLTQLLTEEQVAMLPMGRGGRGEGRGGDRFGPGGRGDWQRGDQNDRGPGARGPGGEGRGGGQRGDRPRQGRGEGGDRPARNDEPD